MLPEQRTIFESMAVSDAFDDEGTEQQNSLYSIWKLTPRVFEKEAADEALRQSEQGFTSGSEGRYLRRAEPLIYAKNKEIVVAYWDPDLYHSKIWPLTCLFGASFGALHLISWNSVFPTFAELWLWRAAALTSIGSMLVFMNFKKVIPRWGGPMTMISLLSPALYLLSRLAMMGGVIATFRASEPAIYQTYVVSTYWVHVL